MAAADLAANAPPAFYVPKLKYRNPIPADHLPSPPQSPLPSAQPPAAHQKRPTSPDSKSTSISSRLSSETASLTSLSLASTTSSATTSSNDSKSSKTKKKRKPTSVLGFLSLKEPSQLALEQFAEQQRKQSATKGNTTPTSSSTFVGKQLPSNIPKVNSKWDGIPAAAKNRHSTSTVSSNKTNRSSLSSRGSLSTQLKTAPWNDSRVSALSDGTRNPPNSIISASNSIANLSFSDTDAAYGSSPSTTTLPEMSYYFPDGPVASGALPVEPVDSHQDAPSHEKFAGPPPRLSESSGDFSPRSSESEGFRSASPASSTGSVDTIVKENAEAIYQKLNNQPQPNFWSGEANPIQPVDEDKSGLVPESHDFLFDPPSAEEIAQATPVLPSEPVSYYVPPRPVQNFSRPIATNNYTPSPPRPATYRSAPSTSALPTLYEASLASSAESLATVQNDNDSESIAPSTIAPSELSGHWYESPRERLGLGGRLRMNDVLPWENPGAPGKPKKTRLSMFGLSMARS